MKRNMIQMLCDVAHMLQGSDVKVMELGNNAFREVLNSRAMMDLVEIKGCRVYLQGVEVVMNNGVQPKEVRFELVL